VNVTWRPDRKLNPRAGVRNVAHIAAILAVSAVVAYVGVALFLSWVIGHSPD